MRSRPSHFKNFIAANPGGATRRNPKRKNAGALSSRDIAGPSAADIEASFQRYLKNMSQTGAYGDNVEIGAFASRYLVHVVIYEEAWGQVLHHRPEDGVGEATRKAYIIHHVSGVVHEQRYPVDKFNSHTSITLLSETPQDLTQAFPTFTSTKNSPQQLKLPWWQN